MSYESGDFLLIKDKEDLTGLSQWRNFKTEKSDELYKKIYMNIQFFCLKTPPLEFK